MSDFPFLYLQCKTDTGINSIINKEIILEYEQISGWNGSKISIIIFQDKTAIKSISEHELPIYFSQEERKKLDISVSEFDNYNRKYPVDAGTWFGDIDTYRIIHHKPRNADTVSINEPLDSTDIPETLVSLVTMLRQK